MQESYKDGVTIKNNIVELHVGDNEIMSNAYTCIYIKNLIIHLHTYVIYVDTPGHGLYNLYYATQQAIIQMF